MSQTTSSESRIATSAIPTRYKNRWYRSRLEAKWARFFDLLGIEFWYEEKSFMLPDGTPYLPDFYLPRVKAYAEVKPTALTPEELSKCRHLSALVFGQTSGQEGMTLLLVGPPDFKTYWACLPFDLEDGSEVATCDYLLDIDYHRRKYYEREGRFYGDIGEGFDREEDFSAPYRIAVHDCRNYRFQEVA